MSTITASDRTSEPVAPGFDEVFREYHPLIYRTAYGVTGSVQDAEDIVQTILFRVLRREISLDATRNPKGYLYRTTVNLALSIVRSRRRFILAEDLEDVAVASPSRDEELHRRLYEAISELKPKAAEILILRYVHNYTDAQIAKLLGTSRGTIAVNLHRSRARLKKLLRAAMGDRS